MVITRITVMVAILIMAVTVAMVTAMAMVTVIVMATGKKNRIWNRSSMKKDGGRFFNDIIFQ